MRGVSKTRDAATTVAFAMITSGSLVAQHVAGKATRDALFLTHFGLELLPGAMIGAAVVSSVALIGISRALRRYGPALVVPVMFGLGAALFLFEWWLSLQTERGAAIAVYAHTAIFGSAGVSAFWSLVNERFDPHSAKKNVGRIASGGTIGGIIGGVVVWRASEHLSVPMMLAVLAGINVVGLWGALRIPAGDGHRAGSVPEPLASGGWKVVRETVLGLTLEREPLSIAYRAIRSEDPSLRGTAYEYLEVVLPPRLREVVMPLLGDVRPPTRTVDRGRQELAEALLRSTASLSRSS